MTDGKPQWASISVRPTHGTATLSSFPSVIPPGKSDKEVFWVRELMRRLPNFAHVQINVRTNEDDSCGNHDVIVETGAQSSWGVQVTELTYELWRMRSNQRGRYLRQIIAELQRIGATAPVRVVAKVCFSAPNPKELKRVPAGEIAAFIASCASGLSTDQLIDTRFGHVMFSRVGTADIYTPSHGNIGVDDDIDLLPRSLEMYKTAVAYLIEKKQRSRSPWLVVWSAAFHRDKHFLGTDVLDYMKSAFSTTPFSHVYFIESIDGEGFFEANIGVHAIKEVSVDG